MLPRIKPTTRAIWRSTITLLVTVLNTIGSEMFLGVADRSARMTNDDRESDHGNLSALAAAKATSAVMAEDPKSHQVKHSNTRPK
jgi:hypothetical protein